MPGRGSSAARSSTGWEYGPRPPSELEAEEAVRHADEIVQAFLDALDPSQPVLTRVKAVVEWSKVEQQDAVLQQRDEGVAEMSDTELVEIPAARIGRLLDADDIRHAVGTITAPQPAADAPSDGAPLELEA